MELKTLKDISKYIGVLDYGKHQDKINTYSENDLKQEAIKWIKELKKGSDSKYKSEWLQDEMKVDCSEHDDLVIEWIKYFFDITEEELK